MFDDGGKTDGGSAYWENEEVPVEVALSADRPRSHFPLRWRRWVESIDSHTAAEEVDAEQLDTASAAQPEAAAAEEDR